MIKVIPFQPEHLEQVDFKENYNKSECPKTVMNTAFTLVKDDKILAILGGFPFVPGVIHFWALISKEVRKCPIEFHKECLKVLEWYEKHEKPRRIQWEVDVNYEMGWRWAEALGLQREGIMRKWGQDGTDHYLYARVNECQS